MWAAAICGVIRDGRADWWGLRSVVGSRALSEGGIGSWPVGDSRAVLEDSDHRVRWETSITETISRVSRGCRA